MKKIFIMLLILFLLYIGIQIGYNFFSKGHEYEYEIITDNIKYNIKEQFVNNTNLGVDSYFFEINNNGSIFYYQTLTDFGNKSRIIKNIYSFKNNEYNCILPIFEGNKIISDIMCLNDNTIYYYHDLQPSDELKEFAKSLSQYGYDANKWIDNKDQETYENVTIYPNNIIDNHHIVLANYKGVYNINPSVGNLVEDVYLFESDVYKRPLSMVFKKYYITANYNEQYRFTKILTVDLTNNKTKEISCDAEISFDSYIQGTYDDSIYIFDRNSKKQYEINLKNNKVLEVGNVNSGIIVYNGDEKTRVSVKNEDVLFETNVQDNLNISGYTKIDLLGGEMTGYYYLYKKDGNKYRVYRTNIQNTNQIMYMFSTTDLNRVIYYNEYIYFLDGNIVKYYSDNTGVKSAFENSELSFNDSLIFGIYTK